MRGEAARGEPRLTGVGKHCHEQGLRILLACIDSHAARHGRYITPLLSVHINFYVRVFVRLRSSKAAVKLSATKARDVGRCGEMWGDVGRCGEICGEAVRLQGAVD